MKEGKRVEENLFIPYVRLSLLSTDLLWSARPNFAVLHNPSPRPWAGQYDN